MSSNQYRQILHQPPAVDFIENRMSNYHPVFDSLQVQWSQTQGQFIAQRPQQSTAVALPTRRYLYVPSRPGPRPRPGLIDEMGFWEDAFPAAMKQLVILPEPQYGTELQAQCSIRGTKTWADVQAKLETAHLDYNFNFQKERTKGFRRVLRRGLDKATPYMKQGAKLIPGSDFTSPVLKVLDFVLDAYEVAHEVRDTVEAGFDDIPAMFADIDFWQQSFQGDDNVSQASISVVLATFKAIEASVKFYVSTQGKRAVGALAKGGDYQKGLVEALQDMRHRSAALHKEAEKSYKYYMMTRVNEVQETLDNNQYNNHIWQANVCNQLFELLNQGFQGLAVAISSRPTTPVPPALPGPTRYSASYLQNQLQIPDIDTTDLDHILLQSDADLHTEDRGRAQQVLSSQLFRDWLLSPGSTKLLIHGDFDSFSSVTPFSALSATLTRAFQSVPGNIALVYFCSLHLHSDTYAGPVWMARSLVAQLLSQVLEQYPSLSLHVEGRVDMQRVSQGHVDALCTLLDALVRQLPAQITVLCIIDGIHSYEDREYLSDTEKIIIALLDLVENRGQGARVKLLLVSPQPTTEVRRVFDEDGTLLHMQQLPLEGEGMHASALQERLEAEIM